MSDPADGRIQAQGLFDHHPGKRQPMQILHPGLPPIQHGRDLSLSMRDPQKPHTDTLARR